jgi:hypothetical protein
MYPRTNYEMTQEDLDTILDACKSVPMIMLHIGGGPSSPQENANRAWGALGQKMGFDYMTVQPIEGKGNRFFTAVPSENDAQRIERIARETEEKQRAEVKRLEAVVAEAQAKLAELLK